jgi:hypothetical protein
VVDSSVPEGSAFPQTFVTRRISPVKNPLISHELGNDYDNRTCPGSFVTHICPSDLSDHGDDRKTFEMITSTLTLVQCRSKPQLNYICHMQY